MNLFKRDKSSNSASNHAALAEVALAAIHDGVIITDKNGTIKFINPAAAKMTNYGGETAIGLDYGLVIKIETKEGRELSDQENPLVQAMNTGQTLEPTQVALIAAQSGQRLPIAVSVQIANDATASRVITFRDITKELEEEGEQTEFISTASHEMRTPVATIDGYLSLAINPQTATIDERARGYLTAAEKASKHLGKLFQNLLDVTKLDDGRIKPRFEPVEMVELIKNISDEFIPKAKEAKLTFNFGSNQPISFGENHRMSQVVYGFIDVSFMQEIMNNLIENAIKYTPEGGSIYVNVRGDGDRVLINVTDTGIGISAEDLSHIFQKFYRVDNSDTRTIGGTGLGLYLVKQRAEAMGGKVWAESAFGEGSTFYVSLPRITTEEYEKRMIIVRNQQMMTNAAKPPVPTAQAILQNSPAPAPQPTTPPQSPAVPISQLATQPQPVTQPQTTPPQSPTAPISQPAVQPQPTTPPQPSSQPQQLIPSAPAPQPPATPPPRPTITAAPPSPPTQQLAPTPPVQNLINNNLNGEIK